MDFTEDKLKAARDEGYSDDEIFGHLAKADARFAQAQQFGYKLDEVAAHLTKRHEKLMAESRPSGYSPSGADNSQGYVTPEDAQRDASLATLHQDAPLSEQQKQDQIAEDEQAQTDINAQKTEESSNKPLLNLPKPESEALSGVRRLEEKAEGLLTTSNLMLGSLAALGGIPAKLIGAGFGALAAKNAAEQVPQVVEKLAKGDLTGAGESLVDLGASGLVAAGAAEQLTGRPAATPAEMLQRSWAVGAHPASIIGSLDRLARTSPQVARSALSALSEEQFDAVTGDRSLREGINQKTLDLIRDEVGRRYAINAAKYAPANPGSGTLSATPELPSAQDSTVAGSSAENTTGQPTDVPLPVNQPEPRRIAKTAVRAGNRIVDHEEPFAAHADIKLGAARQGIDITEGEHGFLDENGNFVNRTDAAKAALDQGQITPQQYDAAMAREGENKGLHSEDLRAADQSVKAADAGLPETAAALAEPALTEPAPPPRVSPLDQLRQLEADAAEPPDPVVEQTQQDGTKVNVQKPSEPKGETPGEKMTNSLKKLGRLNRDAAAAVEKELNYYSDEERAQLQQHLGTADAEPETLAQAIMGRGKLKEAEAPSPYGKDEATTEARPDNPELKEAFGEDYQGGPGAMGPREAASMAAREGTSQINQLTERMGAVTDSPSQSITDRIKSSLGVADTLRNVKDTAQSALLRMKAVGQSIYNAIDKLPEYTEFNKAVGEWSGAINKGDFEARQFKRELLKRIPDPVRREAITNWIQADGDEALLRQRADLSTGALKKGYETALNLTEEEKVAAANMSQYLDSMLQQGIDAGLFKNGGVENYVTQLWKQPNPITDKLISDVKFSNVPINLKFAKQRVFGSYFEGEQAGYKPITKDIADLIAIYDTATNRTTAARAFVKSLHEGKASDGRPLVEISGTGKTVPEEGASEASLIKPHSKSEATGDYIELDHPALRDWKWSTQDSAGKPVITQGNLLVHPEIYNQLKNTLSTSALRQNAFVKGALDAQAVLKQTKLSISAFHAVQEGVHAVFHRINPFAPEKLDFDDPLQKELVDHGLQVADYRPMQDFSEGLSGKGGLAERIPGVGKFLHAYNNWLFQDYIPGLKMSMAKHALDRNLQRYSAQLESGKINRAQVVAMTARQANAAFGELNYKMMARNATVQDAIRLATLAPDFLEARSRFVAQAFNRYGGEQRAALALMVATLYVGSRVLNKTLDDDYHWNKPFSFVKNGKEYGLRTIAGDVQHLATDPRSFIYNRLSPISRAATEVVTGRDDRGIKRGLVEQIGDLGSWLLPISADTRDTDTKTSKALGALGVRQANYSSIQQATELARAWKKQNKQESPIEILSKDDKNYALTVALQNGNDKVASRIISEMNAKGDKGTSIRNRLLGPLTGNKKSEQQFVSGLNEKQKAIYDGSAQARSALYQKYLELGGKESPKTSTRLKRASRR